MPNNKTIPKTTMADRPRAQGPQGADQQGSWFGAIDEASPTVWPASVQGPEPTAASASPSSSVKTGISPQWPSFQRVHRAFLGARVAVSAVLSGLVMLAAALGLALVFGFVASRLKLPDTRITASELVTEGHLTIKEMTTPVPAQPPTVTLVEVKGDVPSTRPWVRYEFADPALESLSAGQKILLRTGADNHQRVSSA